MVARHDLAFEVHAIRMTPCSRDYSRICIQVHSCQRSSETGVFSFSWLKGQRDVLGQCKGVRKETCVCLM